MEHRVLIAQHPDLSYKVADPPAQVGNLPPHLPEVNHRNCNGGIWEFTRLHEGVLGGGRRGRAADGTGWLFPIYPALRKCRSH